MPMIDRDPAVSRRFAGSASRTEALLRGIIDTSREAVLVVDETMRITSSNAASTALFRGLSPVGRRLSEVVRDLRLHQTFREVVERSVPADIQLDLTLPDKRLFDVHVAPFELDGRRHAIGFFYDISQVERLERVRQEFLSNISHELRTPLTSIIAFVETLEDGAIDDGENNRRFLSVIRRNAERMHLLIADILELSLIESGNISIEKTDVRLARVIDEVFASLSAKADQRGVVLVHDVHTDARVKADPGRLEQMLTNLIDNAIKFNRPGGSVEVGCERGETGSAIRVADSGEGIMPEHRERIFERFFRVDRSRAREVGGTGLGLAIVKHLARLHGGEVSVESVLGAGTTFRIELPAN